MALADEGRGVMAHLIWILPLLLFVITTVPTERVVKRKHIGIEMKAHGGKLVHVRQTESEREV